MSLLHRANRILAGEPVVVEVVGVIVVVVVGVVLTAVVAAVVLVVVVVGPVVKCFVVLVDNVESGGEKVGVDSVVVGVADVVAVVFGLRQGPGHLSPDGNNCYGLSVGEPCSVRSEGGSRPLDPKAVGADVVPIVCVCVVCVCVCVCVCV